MFLPNTSVEQQLLTLTACIQNTLDPEGATREIKRLHALATANPHIANAFLTEAIRQWRAAAAATEAARIEALYA